MCARRKAAPQNQEKEPFCLCDVMLALPANIYKLIFSIHYFHGTDFLF